MTSNQKQKNSDESQRHYPALTKEEYEDLKDSGATKEHFQRANEKNKERILAKISHYIPKPSLSENQVLNIVLIGTSGSGKSSTGNLILGEEKFKIGSKATSCTATIDYNDCEFDGMKVRVVDTPWLSQEEPIDIATEVLKVGLVCKEGVHAFVFVQNGEESLSKEHVKIYKFFLEKLSESARNHFFFLWTHADFLLKMKNVKEKTFQAFQKYIISLALPGDKNTVEKMYETFDERMLAVENNGTLFEEEEQRKEIISYLKSTALCIKPYKNEAFDRSVARGIEEPPSENYYKILRDLIRKNNDELQRLKSNYGKKKEFECSMVDILTDQRYLNTVRDMLKDGDKPS